MKPNHVTRTIILDDLRHDKLNLQVYRQDHINRSSDGSASHQVNKTIKITIINLVDLSQNIFDVDIMSQISDLIYLLGSIIKQPFYLSDVFKPLRPNLSWFQYGIVSHTAVTFNPTLPGGDDNGEEPRIDAQMSTFAITAAPLCFFLDKNGSPKAWLNLMDFRLKSQNIKTQNSLFNYLLGCILADQLQSIASYLGEIFAHPTSYDQLCKQLLQAHTSSFDDIFENYFKAQQIGNLKASQFLQKVMTELEMMHPEITKDNDTAILRKFFIQSLPSMHRAILAATTTGDLKELACIADRIAETVQPDTDRCYQMLPGSTTTATNVSPQDTPFSVLTTQMTQMASMMADLTNSIAALTTTTSNKQRGRPHFRSKSPHGRNRSNIRRGQLCYFHQRFGNNARKCQPGCGWNRDHTTLEISDFCIQHSKYGDEARGCSTGCKYQTTKN